MHRKAGAEHKRQFVVVEMCNAFDTQVMHIIASQLVRERLFLLHVYDGIGWMKKKYINKNKKERKNLIYKTMQYIVFAFHSFRYFSAFLWFFCWFFLLLLSSY